MYVLPFMNQSALVLRYQSRGQLALGLARTVACCYMWQPLPGFTLRVQRASWRSLFVRGEPWEVEGLLRLLWRERSRHRRYMRKTARRNKSRSYRPKSTSCSRNLTWRSAIDDKDGELRAAQDALKHAKEDAEIDLEQADKARGADQQNTRKL